MKLHFQRLDGSLSLLSFANEWPNPWASLKSNEAKSPHLLLSLLLLWTMQEGKQGGLRRLNQLQLKLISLTGNEGERGITCHPLSLFSGFFLSLSHSPLFQFTAHRLHTHTTAQSEAVDLYLLRETANEGEEEDEEHHEREWDKQMEHRFQWKQEEMDAEALSLTKESSFVPDAPHRLWEGSGHEMKPMATWPHEERRPGDTLPLSPPSHAKMKSSCLFSERERYS